jgi:hypothetical protein
MDFRANIAWNVFMPNGTLIDTVFFTPDCDRTYVRDALVNRDGYPREIAVLLQNPKQAKKLF